MNAIDLMQPHVAKQCLIDEYGSIELAMRESSLSDDFPGLCWHCGAIAYGVEPDAREYVCEDCGRPAVYGLAESIVMIAE